MKLERYLQICLAATVSLATLLLGMGQQNLVLPAMAVFASVTSVYFTDALGWFRLNRHLANVAAVGAVVYAMIDLVGTDPNTRLLSIANLLVYLQVVLFYQKKNERLYWQLLVLSLLQVVVAAALNLGVEFGFLLLTYLLLSLVSLGLLFVHCETRPFEAPVVFTSGGTAHRLDLAGISASGLRWREPKIVERGTSYMEVPAAPRTWSMFNRGMVWRIFQLSALTMGLTFAVFFLTPRFGKSAWQGTISSGGRMIGFDDQVSLGQVGTLVEDDTIVMRMQFEKVSTGSPYEVQSDLYIRGAVLSDYTAVTGMWRPSPYSREDPRHELPQAPLRGEVVRQSIQLDPSTALFGVVPGFALPETPHDLRMHADDYHLFYLPSESNAGDASHIRYSLATTAFRDGVQLAAVPCRRTRFRPHDYVRFDTNRLEPLAELTDEILRSSDVPPDNPYLVAKTLEQHFLQPGNYRYTLSIAESPPRDADPTVHFATESRAGHCEYFASAMALMLRRAGIPSRMVIGYHGGDFNELGHYYQVKNLHAHAWVEAWMEAEHVPAEEVPSRTNVDAGVWVRFDPTPLDALGRDLRRDAHIVAMLKKYRDYLELIWSDYILGLDPERQRANIYRPLWRETISFFQDILFSKKWWSTFGTELTQAMGMDSAENFRRRWFNWRAAPIVLGVILLLVALFLFNRRRIASLLRWLTSRPAAIAAWIHRTRFQYRGPYRRLERVLERHGLRRRPNQTPLEFCRDAAAQLRGGLLREEYAEIPEEIARAFYRERFGQRPLDAAESQAVENRLFALESALSAGRRDR